MVSHVLTYVVRNLRYEDVVQRVVIRIILYYVYVLKGTCIYLYKQGGVKVRRAKEAMHQFK